MAERGLVLRLGIIPSVQVAIALVLLPLAMLCCLGAAEREAESHTPALPSGDATVQQLLDTARATGEIAYQGADVDSATLDLIGDALRVAYSEGLDVEVWISNCVVSAFVDLDKWMVLAPASQTVAEALGVEAGSEVAVLTAPVSFSGCELRGVLCSPSSPGLIARGLTLYKCTVEDQCSFQRTTFSGFSRFSDTTFSALVTFYGCSFLDALEFQSVRIQSGGSLQFSGTELGPNSDFRGLYADGGVSFIDCSARGRSTLEYSQFNAGLTVLDCHVSGSVDLTGASFSNECYVENVKADGNVELDEARFLGAARITDCSFSYLDASGASFAALLCLYRCEFSGYVGLEGAEFLGYTLFRESTFGGSALLRAALFSRAPLFVDVSFSAGSVMKHVLFDEGAEFENVVFENPATKADAFLAASYGFDRVHDRQTADRYYYEAMVTLRKQMPPWDVRRSLEWLFIDLTIGYGVMWQRLPIFWFAFILLASLPFWIGRGLHKGQTYLHAPGLGVAVYYVSTLFFGVGTAAYAPRGGFRYLAAFVGVLGKILIGLLFAVLGRAYMR